MAEQHPRRKFLVSEVARQIPVFRVIGNRFRQVFLHRPVEIDGLIRDQLHYEDTERRLGE